MEGKMEFFVQDSVIIEPTKEARLDINKAIEEVSALVEVDYAAAEQRAAGQVDTVVAKKILTDYYEGKSKPKRDKFPNSHCYDGRYGMYRTPEGHQKAVARCMRTLVPIRDSFDVIYVTGLSGSIPAAVVAYKMKKDILILRKRDKHGDTLSHGNLLEGFEHYLHKGTRYLILDDFVSSGRSIARLVHYMPRDGSLAGIMLYGHPRGTTEKKEGYAKEFSVHQDGSWTKGWIRRMIRRGPNSMMFDLVNHNIE